MYDYQEKIKAFIQVNFVPSNAENANVKLTTNQLLQFLWNAFPIDCISDYLLVEILESLGYTQTMYVVETPVEKGTKKNKVIEIKKSLQLGWCLKSPFDLRTETVNDLSANDKD